MSRRLVGICVILLAGVVLSGAATREDFVLKTGEDLIDLCTVDEKDPVSEAAFNFCLGFAVGTYRMLVDFTKQDPVVCLPENAPSRNEAIQMFVAWARHNPQYHKDAPEDMVVRFILQQWPCPK
jgi:hypothetical protein